MEKSNFTINKEPEDYLIMRFNALSKGEMRFTRGGKTNNSNKSSEDEEDSEDENDNDTGGSGPVPIFIVF